MIATVKSVGVSNRNASVYTVNEPSDISGDLFSGTEHEIPDTKRRGDSGKGKAKQGGSRVLAIREAPDAPGIYYATTQLVAFGEIAKAAQASVAERKADLEWSQPTP